MRRRPWRARGPTLSAMLNLGEIKVVQAEGRAHVRGEQGAARSA